MAWLRGLAAKGAQSVGGQKQRTVERLKLAPKRPLVTAAFGHEET